MPHIHFERPTAHKPDRTIARRIAYLFLVAATGLIAGGLGFALMLRLFIPPVDYRPLMDAGQLSRRQGTLVTIDQPILVVSESVEPSLVIFVKRVAARDSIAEILLDPTEVLAQGAVVTSDGWLVGQFPLGGAANADAFIDGQFYQVVRSVTDPYTGLTFAKIEAENLFPVQFSESLPAYGEFVFSSALAHDGRYRVAVAHVSQSRWSTAKTKFDAVKDGSELHEFIQLDRQIGDQIIFTTDGAVAGIVRTDQDQAVIPARHIQISFEQMLKGIADVEFGAFYVDTILESRLTGRGATIYHPARNPIRANTLAARAGLTALDIIVSVNGIILNDEMTFEYAWRKYQHDDSVRLLIRRGGREATIDIGPGT